MRALITVVTTTFAASPALPHGLQAHDGLLWTFDPWIVIPLAGLALPYLIGSIRLSRRRRVPYRDVRAALQFWSGWLILAAALVSPIHDLGEHLFTVHMIEHELVMAIAAPLLALARPLGILLWSMPQRLRRVLATTLASSNGRALWQGLTLPFIASSIHGLAIWIWHVPALFDATVSEVLLHRLQHLSFFTTGLLFWWAIFWRCDRGRGAWHLFVTMLHTGLLGAIITLAPEVVYDDQTRFASEWELTPLEDQQLAGLIMWVPGGLIYAGVALWFLTQWIKSAGKGGMDAHDFRAA